MLSKSPHTWDEKTWGSQCCHNEITTFFVVFWAKFCCFQHSSSKAEKKYNTRDDILGKQNRCCLCATLKTWHRADRLHWGLQPWSHNSSSGRLWCFNYRRHHAGVSDFRRVFGPFPDVRSAVHGGTGHKVLGTEWSATDHRALGLLC